VEVARPVAFSVLIIAIILVPLFTLQGVEGKMFAPLALTMLIAMLVSLGVALIVARPCPTRSSSRHRSASSDSSAASIRAI